MSAANAWSIALEVAIAVSLVRLLVEVRELVGVAKRVEAKMDGNETKKAIS